jgi:GDP-4-dehydro-6-deoxy-D-mannose reductase
MKASAPLVEVDFFVSGGSGFLGRTVLLRLRQLGYSFATLGRTRPEGSQHHVFFDASSSAVSMLQTALGETHPRWVLHLAGAAPASPPELAYRVNAAMLGQIIAGLGNRVSRIVAIGTAAEYGETLTSNVPVAETAPCLPVGHYGLSKYAQTMVALAARRRGTPVTIARTFNLVGPGVPEHVSLGRFVKLLHGEASSTGILKVGSLDKRRDFVEVGAAANAIIGLATSASDVPPVVNVCSGTSTPLQDWLEGLIAAAGIKVSVETISSLRRSFDPDDVVGCKALLQACGWDIPAPKIDEVASAIWRHEHAAATGTIRKHPASFAPELGAETLPVSGLAGLARVR